MLQPCYYYTNEFDHFIPLLECYPHEVVLFKKKEYIKGPYGKFHHNYLIMEGFCKVSVIHSSGEEKLIGYWGKGSIFPIICTEQEFLLEDSIIVITMSNMVTWQFDIPIIKNCIQEHPEIAFEMIDHYSRFTNLLLFCITTQTYENIKTRICNMLLIYYQNLQKTDVHLSQSELASMIGAKRESVVKVLRELREDGIISTSRSHIQILSVSRLSEDQSLLLQ